MARPPIDIALIGAGNRGYFAYGDVLRNHPDKGRYVAVAEPNEARRERFARRFNIPKDRCFERWEDLLHRPLLADAVLNATQDAMHVESTLAALDAGYHVLLEKPMALSPHDCLQLVLRAEEKSRILQICHVLRFSKMFRRAKQLINQGKIGEVLHIAHNENVGYWHFAHSYVRGNWRRKDESSFLMLTKSCHDTDIMGWFVGQPAKRLSSFGSLKVFRPDHAPEGATLRCTDGCAVEAQCPYSALKLYLDPGRPEIPAQLALGVSPKTVLRLLTDTKETGLGAMVFEDLSRAGIRKALEEGPYGRCVYHCDNDVVDHQVLNIEYEGGATASFSLNAFTTLMERTTKITGTNGEIRFTDFRGRLELRRFSEGSSRFELVPHDAFSHGGGDDGLLLDFLKNVRQGHGTNVLTSARNSLESHYVAFASEESRLSGKTVDMDRYRRRIEKETQDD